MASHLQTQRGNPRFRHAMSFSKVNRVFSGRYLVGGLGCDLHINCFECPEPNGCHKHRDKGGSK